MSSDISGQQINVIKRRRTESGSDSQLDPSLRCFVSLPKIEIPDMKTNIKRESKEWFNVRTENNELMINKINALEEKIKTKDLKLKEMIAKNEGLMKDCRLKTDKLKTCVELNRNITKNLDQLREEETRVLKSAANEFKKRIEEKDKQIQDLKTTEYQFKNMIEEQKVTIEEKEKTIKCLTEDNNKFKTECQTLKKQIKNLESESAKLRQQRQYFKDRNDTNKRNTVSNAVYGIDIQTLYANQLRSNAINTIGLNVDILEGLGQQIQQLIDDKKEETKSDGKQLLANTIETIGDEIVIIKETKKTIDEKRADGRVNCCYCPKICQTMADLKRHLTVRHNKNTSDMTKSRINIIEIDD